jgi:hypothetical protein
MKPKDYGWRLSEAIFKSQSFPLKGHRRFIERREKRQHQQHEIEELGEFAHPFAAKIPCI